MQFFNWYFFAGFVLFLAIYLYDYMTDGCLQSDEEDDIVRLLDNPAMIDMRDISKPATITYMQSDASNDIEYYNFKM
jgi:hypothetical protein